MPNTITTTFFFFFVRSNFSPLSYSTILPQFSHSSPVFTSKMHPLPNSPCQNHTSHIISLLYQSMHNKDCTPTSVFQLFKLCSHHTLPSHAMSPSITSPLIAEASGMFLCPELTPGSAPVESSQAQPLINAIVRTEEEPP